MHKTLEKAKLAYVTLALFCAWATPALADSGDITKVQTFIQNIIQVLVTFSGLIAAGFFVMGGVGYITSSGNPEHLDRSKKTLVWSGVGLAVVLGAFVLSNIVSGIATTAFK